MENRTVADTSGSKEMSDQADPETPGSNLSGTRAPEKTNQCCVCMRTDQKLLHLCLINGANNSLFALMCENPDDYVEIEKEPMHLIICWDCDAIMSKIVRFRQKANKAQICLSSIAEGRSLSQNGFFLTPPLSGARGSGPEAIYEHHMRTHADLMQPLLRVVRYVLPDGSATALPQVRDNSGPLSLLELLEGIQQ